MSRPGSGGPDAGLDTDVAIVGAGAAGLTASAVLRKAGISSLLIEAGDRVGGRAHTVRPDCLGGARFDTGATWLHQSDRNPLVSLAHAHGIPLARAHLGPRRLFIDDRAATDAQAAGYDNASEAWTRAMRRSAAGPDRSLAEAFDEEPGQDHAGCDWIANIENWEGAIIAAADADTLSLHDWNRNQLDERDLSPPDGVGTLLQELLVPMAGEIRLGCAIEAIDWRDASCCLLHGKAGVIRAGAVIVTVSTGVLQAGRIAFDPALPPSTHAAIAQLPMGLLNKLALPATGTQRLALDPGTLLEQRLSRRDCGGMLLSAWPSGLPYVTGFFGGRMARGFAGRPAAALAQAHATICRLLGPAAGDALDPGAGMVTDWSSDPLFEGAYAFCRPGQSGARAALAEPVCDRLLFAGEACRTDGLAGTVGGAMADGERAAQWLLRRRFGIECAPGLTDGFPTAPKPV